MAKWKVYVSRKLSGNALERLKEQCEVEVNPNPRPPSREEFAKAVAGKDAIISLLTDKIDASVFDAAGNSLKIVSNYAVGFDNVDLATATSRGIIVTNTPGVLTEAVAEHAIALMLAIARKIPQSDKYVRSGFYSGWSPDLFLGTQLEGKTFGIVGLGRIGFSAARRAHSGFGMKIMYSDPKQNAEFEKEFGAKFASLEEILKECDFVSLHVPLLPSTRHLIGEEQLNSMKPTAYLINTSRGPIVDEQALYKALKSNKIAGAALDVFESEPALYPGLSDLQNVVLTPHTASATIEARSAMADLAVDNILAVLRGEKPQALANPEAWEKRRI